MSRTAASSPIRLILLAAWMAAAPVSVVAAEGASQATTALAAASTPAPGAALAPAQPAVSQAALAAVESLSVKEMFGKADWVVKAVMIFLLLCSVLTGALLIEKTLLFNSTRRANARFLATFRKCMTSEQQDALIDSASPMGKMWQAAKAESARFREMHPDRAFTPHQADRFLQRVSLAVGVVQDEQLSRLGAAMGILATIGSTAPFIGLFGTVWGILHSFAQIAATKTSSLAVVAPGIAEALLATAIGLFAAIPAVMIYNKFVRDMNGIVGSLDNFTSEMIAAISRELDVAG